MLNNIIASFIVTIIIGIAIGIPYAIIMFAGLLLINHPTIKTYLIVFLGAWFVIFMFSTK